ncbi:uncharacterized protein [Clytia hemisphaerica]|uniref:uncharacterized protein isoform X2 n=1 Tax=Clytia hemisphaerica TaxID=252671 RepID=UPI0034D5051F
MSEKLSVDLFSDDEIPLTPPSKNTNKNFSSSSPRKISVKSCEPPLSDDDDDDDDIELKSPKPHNVSEKIDREQNQQRPRSVSTSKQKDYSRFVIVSWKIRQYSTLSKSVKSNTLLHQYRSDATLDSIIVDVRNLLQGNKVLSVAFICHGSSGAMTLCRDRTVTHENVDSDEMIRKFFFELVDTTMNLDNPNSHLDFLASSLPTTNVGQQVIKSLQDFLRIPIFASKDILGVELSRQQDSAMGNIGELYFNANLLRSWSGSSSQSISNYEKIRTLGRGAYGTAVLYRKKDDDSLVVLKEITILDLSATERQASMNEVRVLGMLSHPNIISYYDSFDEDGTLWIEMEYADGGTLSDYLAKQDTELEEREILIIFSQMVSAIRYCHDRNILHRDLKTQNIFLTQDLKVKLGDFGIAKVMNTHNAGNFTVVGTPYYISPEMCEGKPYDSKSDIWALGCILYEMAQLTKTFDGTNLPALITKIVKGTFAPVKETYSPDFRALVRDLLQKDPIARPTAEEILFQRLPELLQQYNELDDTIESQQNFVVTGRTRSLLYYCDVTTMNLYPILELPQKIQVAEVSVGLAHIVIVSVERGVFSWGDNSYGQLGHGDFEAREHPTEIVLLRGKSIVKACCGDYFTTFLSDNGLVLTCGQGEYGSLGHGDWNSIARPKLLDALLTLDIASLETGAYHIAITTAEGHAFTWGRGDDGRLGHGNESHLCVPTRVKFDSDHVFIRGVQCSMDGTMFIADTGTTFACGKNDGNKLGINPRQGFLLQFRSRSNKVITSTSIPTLNKDMCKYQVSAIKFGGQHCCLINENGQAFSSGNNTEAQLGCGNTKTRDVLTPTKLFEGARISLIACGSTFTFAGVQESSRDGKSNINSVYFWGTKPRSRRSRTISSSDSSAYSAARSARGRRISTVDEDGFLQQDELYNSINSDSRASSSGGFESSRKSSRLDSGRLSTESYGESEVDDSRRTFLRNILKGSNTQTLNMVPKESTPVTVPQIVFKFQSIGGIEGWDEEEEFPVDLHDIKCFQDHVIIHLETTAPPPKCKKLEAQKSLDSSLSLSGRSVVTNRGESSGTNSEMDMSGEVPTWIRNELEDGIPVFEEEISPAPPPEAPLYIDSGNASDDEENPASPAGSPAKRPFPFNRTKSYDTLSRRGSMTLLGRDPNFNIIPKLKKQNPMLKRVEETDDLGKTETRIIDGVAVTVSTTEISEDISTSPNLNAKRVGSAKKASPKPVIGNVSPEVKRKMKSMSADAKKREKQKKPADGDITARSSSAVEYTPVEDIYSEELAAKLHQEKKSEQPQRSKSSKLPLSKARAKRVSKQKEQKSDFPQPRPSKNVPKHRKAKQMTSPDANNNNEIDQNLFDEFQRQAKISEEKLRKEIEKIQEDKEKREELLREAYEKELKAKEEWTLKKDEEAKQREEALKDEIKDLKTDLSSQNNKLQDNHNILLSVQEQLMLLQKGQLRQSTTETPHQASTQSSSNDSLKDKQMKSSICSVM